MRSIQISGVEYSDDTKPFIIAEIGHNHQGRLDTCIELIRAAADAGASAVKLQKRDNRLLYTPAAFDAPYNSENAYGSTYGKHREALELTRDDFVECIAEAKRCGIVLFSTAFDFASVDFLAQLDMPVYKVASGDLKSTPLIKYIAQVGKPMILSTGGATLEDVDRAVSIVEEFSVPFALLQCTAGYPPLYSEINLKVIETFRERYPNTVIGYSGHDSGIAIPLAAFLMGARVIEKHFTLNRTMKGTDHSFSLEPTGMRKMVRDINRVYEATGDGQKRKYDSENEPLRKMGKQIVLNRDLKKGAVVEKFMLEIRSPAEGLEPWFLEDILGKKTSRDITAFEALRFSDFI